MIFVIEHRCTRNIRVTSTGSRAKPSSAFSSSVVSFSVGVSGKASEVAMEGSKAEETQNYNDTASQIAFVF